MKLINPVIANSAKRPVPTNDQFCYGTFSSKTVKEADFWKKKQDF
jgi:hypothetical protein